MARRPEGTLVSDLAAVLEPITRAAWPAADQQAVGGWVLRAHHGVTRRANSIWTAAPEPPGWELAAADFYGTRGLPVRLQVGDSSPVGLDARLAAAGYVAEARTSVLVAATTELRANLAGGPQPTDPDLTVAVTTTVTPVWLDAYLDLEGIDRAARAPYAALFGRLPGSYALATVAGTPVSVVLGTDQSGWLGLSCLVTAESHRGRGIAGTLLGTLVERHRGPSAWLQVMDVNTPARRLYERLGFTRAYGYHYRTLPR